MKKFKSLCFAMVFFMALAMLLPTSAYAAKSAGTIKNNVQVLMEYVGGETVAIPHAKVGVKGGLLGTKFLLGSDYHECNNEGKVTFKQTSRVTDMYFELPDAWKDKVETEEARADYRAKLIGNFRYRNYKANITNNKFRVGMPLAWTTVDTTIYLKAKYFTVFFDKGDYNAENLLVEYLKQVKKPNDPVREGYTFKGWYKDGKEFNFETPITDNITLTAKWEINKYTVKFVSDGEQVAQETVEFNKTVNKPEDPKKEGHTFLGWHNGEEKFNFDTPIKGDITLTAKWKINKYTVTFMSDNSEIASYEVKYGEKVSVPDVELAKEGWIFRGWVDSEDKEFNPTTPIKSNMILTAKWVVDTRIGSAKVSFYVYNELSKGKMKWDARHFIPVGKDGAYISNAGNLKWNKDSFLGFNKHYYIMTDNIPKESKLYDADMVEVDVKKFANDELIANMKNNVKNKLHTNCELRIYRLTKVEGDNIHVDLAFYDLTKGNWVHELD